MTKKEKTTKCQEILYKTIGEILDVEDYNFMLSIFEAHQQWEQKKGSGVKSISVGSGSHGTKCFYINRTDGSSTDISFTKCITHPTKLSLIKQACRHAIKGEIKKFKSENVFYGESLCPITGLVLVKGNVHIDHYDLTFDEMFKLWIGQEEICEEYLSEQIEPTLDNTFETRFKDTDLDIDFVRFHNANCKLRAVSSFANLSILRKIQ
jgi:hypothetical protein